MNRQRVIPVALLIISAVTFLFTAPLGAATATTAVRLVWDANPEPDLAGYLILYGTVPGDYPDSIDVGNVTTFQIDDLPGGEVHYFVAVAYDLVGNRSPQSNEVAIVPTVASPSLSISSTASPNPVPAGEILTYTLDYMNSGAADASGVLIAATVPSNTTFVSATAGGTSVGSTVYWAIGDLLAGMSSFVQLSVQIDSPLPNGTTITSGGYSIDSNETAPSGGPGVSTTVTFAPLLHLSKTHIPDKVRSGDYMTYRITYSNLGNAPASRAVITDVLPPNTSFVWATEGGSYGNGTVIWFRDSIPPGTTDTVHAVLRVSNLLPAGTLLTSDRYTIVSNNTLPFTGVPDVVRVVAALPPRLSGALDKLTGSKYIMAAGRHTAQIAGTDFQVGASVDLGPGITIRAVTWVSPSRLDIEIDVAGAASPGPRQLTVRNPDLGSADLVDALSVVRSPDYNGNCAPDGAEFIAVTRSFNTTRGDPDFAEAADLDGDDAVGPADLAIFLMYIGKWFPTCL